jgi:hypothetical protein
MTCISGGAGGGHRARRAGVRHEQRLAREPAEVADHVEPLGWGHYQPMCVGRVHWQQPALGADDDRRHGRSAVGRRDPQIQDPGVAAIEHPEPVHRGLHGQFRPDLAVDQHHVPEVLADPRPVRRRWRDRVQQRPVWAELPVLHHHHQLVGADRAGQQRVAAGVEGVAQQVAAGQPGDHVHPRIPEVMVVIPRQGGWLLIRVGHRLGCPGPERIRLRERVAVIIARDEPAVQVGQDPHLGERREL